MWFRTYANRGHERLLRIELGLEKLDIFAHSMGTMLAMLYAERHPERVSSLTLAGAMPLNSGENGALARNEAAQKLLDRPEVKAELARIEAEAATQSKVGAGRRRTSAWRVQFAAVNVYDVGRWRDVKGGQAFYNAKAGESASSSLPERWDVRELLRAREVPVTLIQGDHDFVDLGVVEHAKSTAGFTNVELIVLPRAGHNAWFDQPEAFRSALARGLRHAGRSR